MMDSLIDDLEISLRRSIERIDRAIDELRHRVDDLECSQVSQIQSDVQNLRRDLDSVLDAVSYNQELER